MPYSQSDLNPESWSEYRRLVLAELQRGEVERQKLAELMASIEKDLLVVKTRAAFWGGLLGFGAGIFGTVLGGLVVHFLTS